MGEGKNSVIKTGVDRLLEYVQEHGETELGEAVDELGSDKDTVLTWASALEDSGLVEIHYSARRGRVLKPAEDEVDRGKVEEVREETSEELDRIQRLEAKQTELEQFEEVLGKIERNLEEDIEDAEELEGKIRGREELERVKEHLDRLEEAEEEVEEMESRIEDLVSGLKVLEEMEKKSGSGVPEEKGFLDRLKDKLPFTRGSKETFKCGECGKEFETRRGLETHRGMKHDG